MKRCRQRWTRTATCTPTSRWRQPDSLTALCREPLATKIAANVANLQPLKKKNPEKRCITNAFQDSKNTKYLFPLDTARSFLSRFAYRIQLRVLVFFSLFRQQRLSDFLLPWCCQQCSCKTLCKNYYTIQKVAQQIYYRANLEYFLLFTSSIYRLLILLFCQFIRLMHMFGIFIILTNGRQ